VFAFSCVTQFVKFCCDVLLFDAVPISAKMRPLGDLSEPTGDQNFCGRRDIPVGDASASADDPIAAAFAQAPVSLSWIGWNSIFPIAIVVPGARVREITTAAAVTAAATATTTTNFTFAKLVAVVSVR
jgi:hypothetical protein